MRTTFPAPIVLLTDFGLEDWFVGAMKGRILARLPGARLIDLSHGVPPGRVETGAFMVECALDAMPEEAIFCCVVDPGVGGPRRALCGRIGRWGYAGPDNGLATALLERAGRDFDLHRIEHPDFMAPRLSTTFHGRDLFAPAAAALAAGRTPTEAGAPVHDPVRLPSWRARCDGDTLIGRVMMVDRFGNLVTNIHPAEWRDGLGERRFELEAGPLRFRRLHAAFSEVEPGRALAYWGSAGTLEIAVNRGSAASATGLQVGATIRIRPS